MTKMRTQQMSDKSAHQILQGIEERIDLLQTIKGAVIVAFGLATQELTTEAQPKHKKSKRSVKRVTGSAKAGRPANTQALVLSSLGDKTLSASEIFEHMQGKDWHTTSRNPRGLLGATLRNMSIAGKLRKVGNDWEVMPSSVYTGVSPEATA